VCRLPGRLLVEADVRDSDHGAVVVVRPDDLLVGRELDEVRLAAEGPVSEPVGENRVAVRQALEPGDELQADPG
jgi:hypothetical protein